MSHEIRRITLVMECPVDLAKYPESSTPAERAEIDCENFQQDPKLLLDLLENQEVDRKIRVTSVVIE